MSAPIECTNNELAGLIARLKAEGKRASSITVIPTGYRLTVMDDRPEQADLTGLLDDPNLMPEEREGIVKLLAHTVEAGK